MTRSFVVVLCTMPDGATVGDALAACVGARFVDTVGERASLRDRVAADDDDDDDNDGADERDTSLAGVAIVARRGWPAEDNSLEWRHTHLFLDSRNNQYPGATHCLRRAAETPGPERTVIDYFTTLDVATMFIIQPPYALLLNVYN